MPLKVLLADDSAAIRKVVQLSLQDFGVEVKSIGSGKDVIEVAKSFHPDIAFVDVLLPHKSGYDVALEMKKDPALASVPIVMLWSSFMNFDEGKYKSSKADDKLEKPFEVAGLRALIAKYVPKTNTNPISRHIDFPKVDFDESHVKPLEPQQVISTPKTQVPVATLKPEAPKSAKKWDMGSFEDISDFDEKSNEPSSGTGTGPFTSNTQTNYGIKVDTQAPLESDTSDESQWIRKDLSRFTVNVPEDDLDGEEDHLDDESSEDVSFVLRPNQASASPTAPNHGHPPAVEAHAAVAQPTPQTAPSSATQAPASNVNLDPAVIAKVTESLRAELTDVIEKIAWKIVPEIASNVIRQELQRLLDEEK